VPNTASRLLGAFVLSVNGTLSASAPLTLDNVISGPTLKFVGASRALFGANWAAFGNTAIFEIALTSGNTGSYTGNLKAKRWMIDSGTLNVTGQVRPDSSAANSGILLIGSSGTLQVSDVLSRISTTNTPFASF